MKGLEARALVHCAASSCICRDASSRGLHCKHQQVLCIDKNMLNKTKVRNEKRRCGSACRRNKAFLSFFVATGTGTRPELNEFCMARRRSRRNGRVHARGENKTKHNTKIISKEKIKSELENCDMICTRSCFQSSVKKKTQRTTT